MALLNCSECGKQISNKATKCIHCGSPIDRHNISINANHKRELVNNASSSSIVIRTIVFITLLTIILVFIAHL